MRLFNVRTRSFEQIYTEIPDYAIASHRWDGGTETSLQDVQERRNTDKAGYKKLEGFAEYVKTHIPDVEYLWIDTCCIDQTNNAELSEAINSMFRWYRNAVVCLAYLSDVSNSESDHEFRDSRWFTRGWTLQELVAPQTVLFLTAHWQVIGHTGVDLSDGRGPSFSVGRCLTPLVALAAGVPEAVLDGSGELDAFSKEERLGWVRGRSTTREEDMSYCLVGILDAAMVANYGEGAQRARRRLMVDIGLMDTPKPSYNVPFRLDPHYIERAALLDQINFKLATPAARIALVGLGGVGKSQLAIEHSYRLYKQQPDTWVLWLHASNLARFEQSVSDVADLLQLNGRKDPKPDVLRLFRNWLRDASKGSWLVVLDNADDASFLLEPPTTIDDEQNAQRRIDYIPPCEHGLVLITSRSRGEALKLVYEDDVVDVMPMSEVEAEEMLVSKLGKESADDRALVRSLDCIPLAIAQAAAYIRERGLRCSVQQYLGKIEQSRQSRTDLLRRQIPLPNRDAEASNAVMLTLQISFRHIYQTRKSAAELLSLMSFCDRLGIPEILIRADSKDIDSAAGSSGFEEDILTLRSFSLVSETAGLHEWEMHRLVQDATQVWLEELGRFEEVYNRFIYCLSVLIPDGSFVNWSLCGTLYPHAKSAAEQKPTSKKTQLEWALVMHNAASYAKERGDYDSALPMATSSMSVRTEQLGDEEKTTQLSKMLVASTYRKQGRWEDAEQLEVDLVGTCKAKLGPEHLFTLDSMIGLASTYREQGRWEEAEELEVEVIEKRKAQLGPDHEDTLSSINNLAATYSHQGRWKEAEKLEEEAMKQRRAKLGADNLGTLTSMNNLAVTYLIHRRWKEAEQLLVKVLETRMAKLAEHPDTFTSMENLASTYSNQERWAEADELQAQAVDGYKKVYGLGNSITVNATSKLADIRSRRMQTPVLDVARETGSHSEIPRRSYEVQEFVPDSANKEIAEQSLRKSRRSWIDRLSAKMHRL